MAQFVITIPDAQVNAVVDAFAKTYNWSAAVGMTKTAYAKLQVRNFIMQTYLSSLLVDITTTLETERENASAKTTLDLTGVDVT